MKRPGLKAVHPESPASSRARAAMLVVAGGFAAATFDIVYAWVFWSLKAGVPMRRILQSVAAGLLGEASFAGGVATAALGLVLHYTIATTMSVTYFLAARRRPVLIRRPLLCGAAYGLLLYGIMYYVVIPLSAAGGGSKNPLWIAMTILVHMLLIGIPVALAAQRAVKMASPGGLQRSG